MEGNNGSTVTDFVLLGFSDLPQLRLVLLVAFSIIYLISAAGNLLMISLIIVDRHLHTPMYFFLCHLSFVDLSLTTTTVPRLIRDTLESRKIISFNECLTQVFCFVSFVCVECFLLAVMAFDRFVAVCNPLRYTTVMNQKVCIVLVTTLWTLALSYSLMHVVLILRLSFCSSNKINHFVCDTVPLFKLSCSDTSMNQLVIFTVGSLIVMVPFLIVVFSYARIVFAIFKISSADGRRKTFSTCSSHLTVVTLYFGTIMFMYFRPSSSYSLTKDRVASVMYTVLAPTVNPFIYSLRNNDVIRSLKKIIGHNVLSRNV
ncbi:olfactory receptor 5AR1-like [Lissotriton helveticus]